MPQSYPEGTVADGPNGPIVFRGGQWVPVGGAPSPVTLGGGAPDYQYKAPKAAAELENTNVSTTNTRDLIKNRTQAFDLQSKNTQFDNTSKLRDDYNNNASVKAYEMALPLYVSGLKTGGSPAGDLSLIYSYAKVMDPLTGVREGEAGAISNSQPFVESTMARLKNQLNSTGQFSPEMRLQLRKEMAQRVSELNKGYIAERVRYKETAKRNDINAADVVGNHVGERFTPDVEKFWDKKMSKLDWYGNVVSEGGPNHPNGGIPPVGAPGTPPSGGNGPPTVSGVAPQSNPLNYVQGQYGDSTTTEAAGATKSVPNELGIQFMNGLNSLFHAGASDERIRGYASQFGIDPSEQLAYRKANPGFRGSIPVTPGSLSITVPNTSAASQFAGAIAGSPWGTGIGEAGNAFTAGIPQNLVASLSSDPDLTRARFGVARSMNPRAAITGELVGGSLGAIGGELGAVKAASAAARAAGWGERGIEAANFGARRLSDATFGGVSGFNGAEPGQGGSGALTGALAGVGGGLLGEGAGRYALEPVTRPVARGMFGGAPKPSYIDNILSKTDSASINPQLAEAQSLRYPMTLADTSPALRSLTGAAVRRSPNASGIAENVLIPRNRGQIDRLAAGVSSDLGPIENIPQLQDNLIKSARAKAGPLYDQAYAAPPVTSDLLSSVLNTPFAKSSLGEAVNIAKNERVDPNTLSVDFNAAGDPFMRPVPNMRTLDLTKRGMDALLEKYRDLLTRRMNLSGNEAAQAENGVRSDLLKEIDRLNPAYAQARAAYAGPAAERDFINAGQDAFSANPDQLKFNLGQLPPGKAPMVQLGYRDALMQKGNSVRLNSNPFDATLGTPAAEARLRAVYPEGDGPDTLLRRRDLESQMQNTSNDILGNSKTAQRQIADQSFLGGNALPMAVDAGLALTGQVPVATVGRALGRNVLGDALKLGLGKRAMAKADIIAPTLLNPDPAANSAILADALARSEGYRNYLAKRRGMFGAPGGMIGAGMAAGWEGS